MKYRLSFEDANKTPADSFSLKLHAIRKGGYYLSMVNPTTWNNVEAFVSQAIDERIGDFAFYLKFATI
jgi:aminopeptidase-like protein